MRVLLIDDDEDILKMVTRFLVARGHDVYQQVTGFGAVNIAAGRTGTVPDVIILDNYLPEISGVAVLRLLAKDPKASLVPVLVHSADPEVQTDVEAVRHPYSGFVVKGSVQRLEEELMALMFRSPKS